MHCRPKTLADIQQAVRLHEHVKGVGEGHSWDKPFFCARDATSPRPMAVLSSDDASSSSRTGSGAANIVLTTLRPLAITVDEEAMTVDVDAGIKTVDLLTFLANYVTETAPTGWTLPAFPWFVYQSIGGAVSTGTHGSSLTWASLSNQVMVEEEIEGGRGKGGVAIANPQLSSASLCQSLIDHPIPPLWHGLMLQVVSLTMVLADGQSRTFTAESDPFLFKAVLVSVGQLGIITSLKLR
jgi:FAD/FMN-containing dehydrogenase